MAQTKQERVDGRRNRERLLDEARAAFAERGTDVSLRYVARRAEVGIGTLYRHFAGRDALLEAVLRPRFEALASQAGGLLAAESAGDALGEWLLDLATALSGYRGLPAAVLAALRDPSSPLHPSCLALRASAASLLTRAKSVGAVRPDVRPADLLALAAAATWASPLPPGTPPTHLLTLLHTGLRPSAPENEHP